MALPKNRLSPCDCKGGWFYVNRGSIEVVTEPGDDNNRFAKITRNQMLAALKLMVRSPRNPGVADADR